MSRKVLAAAVTGLLGIGLAGCGAAQTARTAQDLPSVPGVNVTTDGIAVRNAVVEPTLDGYPAGADAPIQLTIVNETVEPVRLIGLASPAGQAVTVVESIRIGTPAMDPELAPDPGPEQPPPGQVDQVDLELPPGVMFRVTLQLTQLAEPLTGAGAVPLELRFDNDVVLPLTVPVAPPLAPLPREEPVDVGHH